MASVMAEATVRSFFVTLKRSYAGTPWFHQRILRALGLKRRHLCVEKPNNISIRGMLFKVGLISCLQAILVVNSQGAIICFSFLSQSGDLTFMQIQVQISSL